MPLPPEWRDFVNQSAENRYKLLSLFVVHVRSASLPAALRGARVKVQIKYGGPWCLKCETSPVEVPKPPLFSLKSWARKHSDLKHPEELAWVGVDFGTTCIFRAPGAWRRQVKIRLRDADTGELLGKATLHSKDGLTNIQTLQLIRSHRPGGGCACGRMVVATEIRVLTGTGFMNIINDLDIEPREDALVAHVPLPVCGALQDAAEQSPVHSPSVSSL